MKYPQATGYLENQWKLNKQNSEMNPLRPTQRLSFTVKTATPRQWTYPCLKR